jgi:hypothetical protein
VEQNSTTQFIADKNIVSAQKILPTFVDKLVYDSSSDLLNQSITDFLSKPVILQSGTLTTTDTFSTFPGFIVPRDILAANVLFKNKLDGFLGFRASICFRIVINANRFQQGRYLFTYVPLGGVDSNTTQTTRWINDHLSTVVQRTTVPHVEIDLCCDTEATIKIPFNSARNFFPISSITESIAIGAWGHVKLSPYVPLTAVAGNVTCGFTIYASFEDIQLVSAAMPQSGRIFTSKKSRKSDTEIEQDSANIGPISSALIKVRDASSIIGQIPLLSAYANSVSWFADIGASAAKVFGWSKPVSLAPSGRVTQNYLPFVSNVDGPDMSFPLSYSYENSVGAANGFSGTDIDELSFQYLATIPVWISTNTWSTSQVAGTEIRGFFVNPVADIFTTVVNTSSFKHYSPLQFVASHFEHWRGSIVYKMKIAKTEFHSGRLMIVFSPFVSNNVSVHPTYEDSPYLHRHIIDIRETNEFTYAVPFVSESPYKSCINDTSGHVGSIRVFVVEPLVAPDTVSSSVSLIFEKCAGPDIEFAIPSQFIDNYYTGITPQMGDVFGSVQQGSNVCSNMDSTVGASLIKGDSSVNALHCVGEKILSFRSLLKKPNKINRSNASTVANYMNIIPYGISSGTVIAAVNTAPISLNDMYAYLASCYVYSRGGVRLKFIDNQAVTATAPIIVALDTRPANSTIRGLLMGYDSIDVAGTTEVTALNNMPFMVYRAGYSGEVQVPHYHKYHSRVNSDCVLNASTLYNDSFSSLAPRLYVTRRSMPPGASEAQLLRSISDDGNFGGFISVPPMFPVTSVN